MKVIDMPFFGDVHFNDRLNVALKVSQFENYRDFQPDEKFYTSSDFTEPYTAEEYSKYKFTFPYFVMYKRSNSSMEWNELSPYNEYFYHLLNFERAQYLALQIKMKEITNKLIEAQKELSVLKRKK